MAVAPGLHSCPAVLYDDFLGFLENGSGDKMHVSSDELSAAFAALIEFVSLFAELMKGTVVN